MQKRNKMNLMKHSVKKYIEGIKNLLDNTKNFYKGRKKIIEGFKEGIFSLKSDDEFKEQARLEEKIKDIGNRNCHIDYEKFMDLIYSKERDIDDQLVEKHFLVQDLGDLFKNLKTSKDDPEKDKQLVD